MRLRQCGVAIGLVVAASTARAAAALAQEPGENGPIVLLGAQYGAPQRIAGGVIVLIPVGDVVSEDNLSGARGGEVRGSVGVGGWQVAGGAFVSRFPFWADLLLTLTRTSTNPSGASADSTYLGVEAGLALPVYEIRRSFINVRPSVGIAQRVGGGSGTKATAFTWSIGTHIFLR
jgi:hypothetical protein